MKDILISASLVMLGVACIANGCNIRKLNSGKVSSENEAIIKVLAAQSNAISQVYFAGHANMLAQSNLNQALIERINGLTALYIQHTNQATKAGRVNFQE